MAWKKFPHPDKAFAYPGAALKKNWDRLHRGDGEPFPAAAALQAAWRSYHAGDFGQAVELGLACGIDGYAVANKAAIVYAHYLDDDRDHQLKLLLDAARRCEEHAYALGRYSQLISVIKALGEGLGGKIKDSLLRAIALEPKHADAHIALGAYHAEVIDKVGSLIGGLTYGAKKTTSVEHFETALKLNPGSAIARIEYARGLTMMFGKSRLNDAQAYYREAAACPAADAMEWLDGESARAAVDD
jgi:hypothetical protein